MCTGCMKQFHQNDCNATNHSNTLSDPDHLKCINCLKCKYCHSISPFGIGWSDMKEQIQKLKRKPKWKSQNNTCYECWLVEKAGQQCPICNILYREDDLAIPMITCDDCGKWIHLDCDPSVSVKEYSSM